MQTTLEETDGLVHEGEGQWEACDCRHCTAEEVVVTRSARRGSV